LVSPLVIGNTYRVSFKVNATLKDSQGIGLACSHVGGRFSTVPYSQFNPPSINNVAHVLDTNIITDTANWVSISGIFVADSAYKYFIIGNFFLPFFFDEVNMGSNDVNRCYYHVDDVSVTKAQDVGVLDQEDTHGISYDPFGRELLIKSNQTEKKIEKILLYSVTGQLIYSDEKINNNEVRINCGYFEHGTYFVHVLNKNGSYSKLKVAL
jgi:hypothetical protein